MSPRKLLHLLGNGLRNVVGHDDLHLSLFVARSTGEEPWHGFPMAMRIIMAVLIILAKILRSAPTVNPRQVLPFHQYTPYKDCSLSPSWPNPAPRHSVAPSCL